MSKTRKKQVLKLYATKEDMQRNKKLKALEDSDGEESEPCRTKRIVQKLVDEDTK